MEITIEETVTISKSRYDALVSAAKALHIAEQFINNGIEFGYIRLPDPRTPDPARYTQSKVQSAVAALRAAGVEMGEG